jgi:hypothetical protein
MPTVNLPTITAADLLITRTLGGGRPRRSFRTPGIGAWGLLSELLA